jgi:hypothetical protein
MQAWTTPPADLSSELDAGSEDEGREEEVVGRVTRSKSRSKEKSGDDTDVDAETSEAEKGESVEVGKLAGKGKGKAAIKEKGKAATKEKACRGGECNVTSFNNFKLT